MKVTQTMGKSRCPTRLCCFYRSCAALRFPWQLWIGGLARHLSRHSPEFHESFEDSGRWAGIDTYPVHPTSFDIPHGKHSRCAGEKKGLLAQINTGSRGTTWLRPSHEPTFLQQSTTLRPVLYMIPRSISTMLVNELPPCRLAACLPRVVTRRCRRRRWMSTAPAKRPRTALFFPGTASLVDASNYRVS